MKRAKSFKKGETLGTHESVEVIVKKEDGKYLLEMDEVQITLGKHLAEVQIHLATLGAKEVGTDSKQYRTILGEKDETTFSVKSDALVSLIEKKG